MKYTELTVHTTSEASELVADAMWEHTRFGVTVSDYRDVAALQKDSTVFWDYMDESVAQTPSEALVKCYLEPAAAERDCAAILQEISRRRDLSAGAVDFGTLETGRREIESDDWIEVWKKHFRPIPVGKRIVIVPEWIPYAKKDGEEVILLDSNMAFGTGEHETTRMCLEFLQEYLKEGDAVLDVGCGSGILGISALKLGAKESLLIDLDPIAVESAKHNADKNGVSGRAVVSRANLLDGTSFEADLILANITAEALAILAPSIPNALKKGGILILSGIIPERLGFVKEKYASLELLREKREGEWCALVYRG